MDASKLIQVGMDGPNVNIKLQAEQSENEQHQLIDIGSSDLHTIHNALMTGAKSTGWGMKKIHRAAYQIFHDLPAREVDFLTLINTNQFPQSFCATKFVTTYYIMCYSKKLPCPEHFNIEVIFY